MPAIVTYLKLTLFCLGKIGRVHQTVFGKLAQKPVEEFDQPATELVMLECT